MTPVHQAVQNGHTEIVKILAPLTDNPNAPDDNGNTPIHNAAFNGHTKIVNILAPLTDNPNVLNIYGDTPIQIEMEKPQLMWQQSVAIQKLSNLLNIFKLLKNAMLGHHQQSQTRNEQRNSRFEKLYCTPSYWAD